MLAQNLNYICSDCLGHYVLTANLYNTRAILPTGSQERRETQVVREDNMIIGTSPLHDYGILGFGIANLTPVKGLESFIRQEVNPGG